MRFIAQLFFLEVRESLMNGYYALLPCNQRNSIFIHGITTFHFEIDNYEDNNFLVKIDSQFFL